MRKNILAAAVLMSVLFVGQAHAQKAVFESVDGSRNGAAITYNYKSDSLFQVNAKVGNVTDIQFRSGETIGYIAGGDTKRWMIDKAVVAGVPHIYIKPIVGDISTNIIVNTNLRSYRLNVSSTDEYDPLVIFNVPDEIGNGRLQVDGDRIPPVPERNYRYKFEAKKKADANLMPEEIFDDGTKTYIRINERNKYDMPVLYAVDPWDKKLTLVNYRVKDTWFIADKVMEKGRLFYHQNFYIDFENLQKQKMGKKTVYQTPPSRDRIYEMMERSREDIIYDAIETEEARYNNEVDTRIEDERHDEEMRRYDEEMKERKRLEKEQAENEKRLEKEAEREAKERVKRIREEREAQERLKAEAERNERIAAEKTAKEARDTEKARKAEQVRQAKEAEQARRAKEADEAVVTTGKARMTSHPILDAYRAKRDALKAQRAAEKAGNVNTVKEPVKDDDGVKFGKDRLKDLLVMFDGGVR